MKFNDLDEKFYAIDRWWQSLRLYHIKAGTHTPMPDIDRALRACKKKHDKYYGNTSKYTPHQGKQECARRLS